MSNTPLHPDRALDPHLCYCPRCGGESNSLTIGHLKKARIVRVNGEHVANEKQYAYANRGQTSKTERELYKQGIEIGQWLEVGEHEKIPGDYCGDCVQELEQWEKIVANGGIYWQCVECKNQGVIQAHADICAKVRKHMGIDKPNPCGVEFQKCEEHGGAPDEQEETPAV